MAMRTAMSDSDESWRRRTAKKDSKAGRQRETAGATTTKSTWHLRFYLEV